VIYTDWLGETREWHGWQSPEPGWLGVREAAAMLRVSRQRVHTLISEGKLRAQRDPLRVDVASVQTNGR
jgi:Helix-turn-helix domain